MNINVQVLPFSSECAPCPIEHTLVHRPGNTTDMISCYDCNGTGKFVHEQCRKCAGVGSYAGILCCRVSFTAAKLPTVREWLAKLPAGVKRQWTVELAETGGGFTNTGHATVICGLKGEKLTSMYGQAKCNATHACFFVHAAMVISYRQHRGDGGGTVDFVSVPSQHDNDIRTYRLWEFNDVGVETGEYTVISTDTTLQFPFDAVRAAQRKARCYHCRSAFYATGRSADGPAGALTGAGAAFGGMPSPFKGPGIGY